MNRCCQEKLNGGILSKTKLLDMVRNQIRLRHNSIRTEETYVSWIKKFILFHNKRPPKNMGEPEVERFLSHLAVKRKARRIGPTSASG